MHADLQLLPRVAVAPPRPLTETRADTSSVTHAGGRRSLRFLPAVALIVAMRVRFVWTPMTSDEGGFLAIARAWDRGATLYDDVWVDRPQGLILLFRILHVVGLGTPEGVRILAIAACIVGAIACGLVADVLFGRRAAWITALAVGALTSVPQYEGFLANGELLSGAIGAAGLALVLRATWTRSAPAWVELFCGGLVAGTAFTVKQSGFDAFACAVAAVAWCAVRRPWTRCQRVLVLPTLVGGFSVPVLAMMVHGALTGWDRYWYAVFGYRSSRRSAMRDANWDRFWETWAFARPALLPALAVVIVACVFAVRRQRLGAVVVVLCWLPAAAWAFVLGGQFHRHYWVLLAFPIGTIAGGFVATVNARALRVVLTIAVLIAPVAMAARASTVPRDDVGRRFSSDQRLVKDEHIAAWFAAHAEPGDEIYARCASAGLYGNVSIDPPYPYLWHDAVANVPGAIAGIGALLESPDRPRFVALYQGVASCDPGKRQEKALRRHYRRVATIDGIPILERR
jgi:hypothetical protein